MATPEPTQNLPAVVEPRAVDLPTSLADKIQIAKMTAEDGTPYRVLVIPPELRDGTNVLTPVDEIVQADPNYTPSVRLLRLDVAKHAYKQTAKREGRGDNAQWVDQYALSKVGIHEIAKLAGIEVIRAGTVPSGEAGVIKGEAAIRVRRSDGTWITRADEGVIREDVELEEIDERERAYHDALADDNKRKLSGAALDAHVRSKQREARRHFHAKASTKAILRAMRGILSLPHVYSESDIKKPFVVIGYSFTPDMTDPTVRQAILDRELAVFGRPALDQPPSETPALPPASEASAAPPAADDDGEAGRSSGSAPPPAADDDYRPVQGEHFDEGVDEDPPPPDTPTSTSASPGDFVVTFATHAARNGKTLAQITDAGDLHYIRFLAGLEKNSKGLYFKPTKPEHHAARENALAYCHQLGKAEAA